MRPLLNASVTALSNKIRFCPWEWKMLSLRQALEDFRGILAAAVCVESNAQHVPTTGGRGHV